MVVDGALEEHLVGLRGERGEQLLELLVPHEQGGARVRTLARVGVLHERARGNAQPRREDLLDGALDRVRDAADRDGGRPDDARMVGVGLAAPAVL